MIYFAVWEEKSTFVKVNTFNNKEGMSKEFGKWLLDIAKYMVTAVLLSSLFSNVKEWRWYIYIIIILAVISTLAIGLLLIKDKEKK